MVVPYPSPPPIEPLLGMRTPAACVPPLPLLSVAVAESIVVVVQPPPSPPISLATVTSSSMFVMVMLTNRCYMRDVEVKKQVRLSCNDRRDRSTGDTNVIVHAGSHRTPVLWCTWGNPHTNISGIHNGLEGWEALKWGYGVRITMVPST